MSRKRSKHWWENRPAGWWPAVFTRRQLRRMTLGRMKPNHGAEVSG